MTLPWPFYALACLGLAHDDLHSLSHECVVPPDLSSEIPRTWDIIRILLAGSPELQDLGWAVQGSICLLDRCETETPLLPWLCASRLPQASRAVSPSAACWVPRSRQQVSHSLRQRIEAGLCCMLLYIANVQLAKRLFAESPT